MSTKHTIAHGDDPTDFHFYYDYADDKYHLELHDVSINIPQDVIERIVQEVREPDFKLFGLEDNKNLRMDPITGEEY